MILIQETLVKVNEARTRLPYYQTIETRDKGIGERGLVLAVRQGLGLELRNMRKPTGL